MRPLVALHLLYIVALTTNPFVFGTLDQMGNVSWRAAPVDVMANIALMMPLALAVRVSGASFGRVVLTVLGTSIAVELLQLLNSRTSSPIDVLANVAGATIIAAWPGLSAPNLAAPLALTPALWSIGLMWRKLPSPAGWLMMLIWVFVAIGLVAPRTQRWAWFAWAGVAAAPLAAHEPSAVALGFAGGFVAAAIVSRPLPRASALAVGALLVTVVFAHSMPEVLLDDAARVWRGHTAILLATFIVGPLVVLVLPVPSRNGGGAIVEA